MDGRAAGGDPPRSVLARGLSLLDAFGSADTELTLTELAARTGLPKPTAHRLLGELVRWGGVERTANGYRLSMRLFVLGQRAPRPRGLREAALPTWRICTRRRTRTSTWPSWTGRTRCSWRR